MCLVTVDICPGGGLGDDESYECKGYWNQMGQWREIGWETWTLQMILLCWKILKGHEGANSQNTKRSGKVWA